MLVKIINPELFTNIYKCSELQNLISAFLKSTELATKNGRTISMKFY